MRACSAAGFNKCHYAERGVVVVVVVVVVPCAAVEM